MPKRSKYEQIWTNEDGWSDWFYPQMDSYEMACCHCGLVHKVEFEIVERTQVKKNGEFIPGRVASRKLQVAMRVGQDSRATANHRRGLKKNED